MQRHYIKHHTFVLSKLVLDSNANRVAGMFHSEPNAKLSRGRPHRGLTSAGAPCYVLFLKTATVASAFAARAAVATSFVTMVFPIGKIAIPASFKCCIPKGMPMIVIKQSIAEATWPNASHKPAKMNQMILPSSPKPPVPMSFCCVSSFLLMASFPNGKNEKLPITKQALPQGIPTIVMNAIAPTNHHASPMMTPPKINHSKLPIALIVFSLLTHNARVQPRPKLGGFCGISAATTKGAQLWTSRCNALLCYGDTIECL